MKISLIIPTYNRSKYLTFSLPSFINQSLDASNYEIIIVDNNSDDDTKEIVSEIMRNCRCTWKYCIERNQGLHYARNRGILEANSEVVVFGDDDIIASKNWLQFLFNEYSSNANAGIVGGKILPQWEQKPPKWVFDWGDEKTHVVFAYLDNGDKRLSEGKSPLFGCNFSIRKDLAIKIGGSLPDTFPKNMKHLSGSGENGMIDQIFQLGYEIVYLPDVQVFHYVNSSRMTIDYFIDRYERLGIEKVYSELRTTGCYCGLIYRGFIILLNSFYRMIKSQLSPRTKINKQYFKKIMRKYYLSQIIQSIRALCNKQLYHHIKRKNYLSELQLKRANE